ncbi:MAG: hypothetical protein R2710_30445 [Acidimicrobiales bacterium]
MAGHGDDHLDAGVVPARAGRVHLGPPSPSDGRLAGAAAQLVLPKSFGLWILFLVAVVGSSMSIDAADRMAGWVLRFGYYVGATVFLLYVLNGGESVSVWAQSAPSCGSGWRPSSAATWHSSWARPASPRRWPT